MQSFGRRCDAQSGSDKNETRGAGTRRRLNLHETANSFCAHYGGQVAAVAIVSRDRHQVVLADRRRLDCDHDLAGRRQRDDARRCGGIEESLESFQPHPLFHSVMVEEVTTSWRVLGACNHNGPPESRQSPPHVQAGSSRRSAPMMKEARVAGTFPTTRQRWRVPFSTRTSPGDSDTSAPSSSWSARLPERTTPKSVVSVLWKPALAPPSSSPSSRCISVQ